MDGQEEEPETRKEEKLQRFKGISLPASSELVLRSAYVIGLRVRHISKILAAVGDGNRVASLLSCS